MILNTVTNKSGTTINPETIKDEIINFTSGDDFDIDKLSTLFRENNSSQQLLKNVVPVLIDIFTLHSNPCGCVWSCKQNYKIVLV